MTANDGEDREMGLKIVRTSTLDDLRGDVARARARTTEYSVSADGLRQTVARMRDELRDVHASEADKVKRLEDAETKIRALTERVRRDGEQASQDADSIAALKSEYAALRVQHESNALTIVRLNEQVNDSKNECVALQTQHEADCTTISRFDEQVEDLEKRLVALREVERGLLDEVTRVKNLLAASQKRVRELENSPIVVDTKTSSVSGAPSPPLLAKAASRDESPTRRRDRRG